MRCAPALLLVAALLACEDEHAGFTDEAIEIKFEARVAGLPFACGQQYTGLGSDAASGTPQDFRFYVHDIRLVTDAGEEHPFDLDDDGLHQGGGVALLDFEDGTGACMTGSPGTNFEVRGSVPEHGDYVGVEFVVGVPEAMNHLDGATAPAPLNAQGLWWTWAGGYKYVRLDVRPTAQPVFFYHLGATSCDGSVKDGFDCAFANLARVRLDAFDPDADEITVDAAQILAGVDVDQVPDGVKDTLPGCMAFPGDPECPAMVAPLGLRFMDDAPAGGQSLFDLRARE